MRSLARPAVGARATPHGARRSSSGGGGSGGCGSGGGGGGTSAAALGSSIRASGRACRCTVHAVSGGSSGAAGAEGREARRAPRGVEQQQPAARPNVKQQVLTVGSGSDLARTAKLLIDQLDAFGSAEVWCTGVSSQVYGIGVLVTAQEILASRGAGLAATLQITSPDGSPDHEKRSIKKLVIGAVPAPPPRPSEWSGPGDRTSTAAVRGTGELAAALRDGIASDRGGHALEARGEQGVSRAIKAVLALQAELGEPLAVWPWYGAVSDAAAAARGEGPRSVPGTVLLVRRCE